MFGWMKCRPGEVWEIVGSIFAGYVPLASQSPCPIIVYSVANYRPHLSHFNLGKCVIFVIPTYSPIHLRYQSFK